MMNRTHGGSFNVNRLFKQFNNLFKLNNLQCDMAYSLVFFFNSRIFIKNRHSNVCLKFLCDAKLITPLFIF